MTEYKYTPDVILALAYQLMDLSKQEISLLDAKSQILKDLSEVEVDLNKVVEEEEKEADEMSQRQKSLLGRIVMIDKAMAWTPCECPVSITAAVAFYLENDIELGQAMDVDGVDMKIIYPANNNTYGKDPVRIQQNHLPGR